MNAFLRLRDEEMANFAEKRQALVRRRVEQQLRTAELIGGMLEMFGPVFADTLSVLGGSEENPLPYEEIDGADGLDYDDAQEQDGPPAG